MGGSGTALIRIGKLRLIRVAINTGSGIIRLIPDADDSNRLKAWTLLTELGELKGFEEQLGVQRPRGNAYSRDFRGPNWLDLRKAAAEYAARDPAVLVGVGVGLLLDGEPAVAEPRGPEPQPPVQVKASPEAHYVSG